jgi:hypothetical protein
MQSNGGTICRDESRIGTADNGFQSDLRMHGISQTNDR